MFTSQSFRETLQGRAPPIHHTHTPEWLLTFPSTVPITNTEFQYLKHVNRGALDWSGKSEPSGCANPLYFALSYRYTHMSACGKAHRLNHEPVYFTLVTVCVFLEEPEAQIMQRAGYDSMWLLQHPTYQNAWVDSDMGSASWMMELGKRILFGTGTSNTRPQSCWHQEFKPLLLSFLCHSHRHLSPLLSLVHWLEIVQFVGGQHDSPLGRPFF